MNNKLPNRVNIVEVGPRDGLQNESTRIPTELKLEFIRKLMDAGCQQIELTSFVHPQAIPQLADSDEMCRSLLAVGRTSMDRPVVSFSALVPNSKGLERALRSGLKRIAVFTAASDTFTQKNTHMTVQQSLDNFQPLVASAIQNGLSVRGYVSTSFVCPYEGNVAKEKVLEVTQTLLAFGVDQVAISDTIGAASPKDIEVTVGYLLNHVSADKLALHLHDTYGTALANVYAGLQLGITTFDSSAGGLGGCPYASGAAGNLATEDLVYMLDRMNIDSGIDLLKLAQASLLIGQFLKRELPSRQLKRLSSSPPTLPTGH